jgi:hypothetical protein
MVLETEVKVAAKLIEIYNGSYTYYEKNGI